MKGEVRAVSLLVCGVSRVGDVEDIVGPSSGGEVAGRSYPLSSGALVLTNQRQVLISIDQSEDSAHLT